MLLALFFITIILIVMLVLLASSCFFQLRGSPLLLVASSFSSSFLLDAFLRRDGALWDSRQALGTSSRLRIPEALSYQKQKRDEELRRFSSVRSSFFIFRVCVVSLLSLSVFSPSLCTYKRLAWCRFQQGDPTQLSAFEAAAKRAQREQETRWRCLLPLSLERPSDERQRKKITFSHEAKWDAGYDVFFCYFDACNSFDTFDSFVLGCNIQSRSLLTSNNFN